MDGFPRTVEGMVVYSRSEDQREPCVCCPDGVHVYSRGIDLDDYPDRWKYDHDPPSVQRWAHDMVATQFPNMEGKRIRLTMEVLD